MSTDTIKAVFEAMETKDFDKMAAMVSDDFTFSGPIPEPVGKEKWVGLQRALLNGFPDWKFNASFHESGETVHGDCLRGPENETSLRAGPGKRSLEDRGHQL